MRDERERRLGVLRDENGRAQDLLAAVYPCPIFGKDGGERLTSFDPIAWPRRDHEAHGGVDLRLLGRPPAAKFDHPSADDARLDPGDEPTSRRHVEIARTCLWKHGRILDDAGATTLSFDDRLETLRRTPRD